MAQNNMVRVIRRLDEAVVNRIAAGEIIQRPANALKELIENCLDAKATNIQVVVEDGGMKLLQIQDNGTGIRKEDMDIVCERFTTSKLEKYEDLGSIATYGFRGEALASITHIAHVTITTRTADSKCAYRGCYNDGKLKDGALKPCAGNVGTQISVEDLFFNVPARRRALKSAAEEYQKITDVVSKYAIHNAAVGFTLKKHRDSTGGTDIKTPASSTHIDNIRIIYGPAIARELLEVTLVEDRLSFRLNGFVSNANYSTKKPTFLLFINHRLVDSTALRRAVDTVYAAYLPKHTHPFVYLSLEIAPKNVDVNVHPTKHEVHFLNEEGVVDAVQKAIDSKLLGSNTSRTFYMQGMLPSAPAVVPVNELLDTESRAIQNAKVAVNQVVRTDNRERKIDVFLNRSASNSSMNVIGDDTNNIVFSYGNIRSGDANAAATITNNTGANCDTDPLFDNTFSDDALLLPSTTAIDDSSSVCIQSRSEAGVAVQPPSKKMKAESVYRRQEIRLTSVLQLRRDVEDNCHAGLRELLADHTFCGCISPELALVQHQTKLYLMNTTRLTQEMLYQKVLFDFGNMGVMRFSESAPLYELAMLALDLPESGWKASDGNKEELARFIVDLLSSKADMLRQYFSIDIDASCGQLRTLPLLLDNYIPPIEGLPMYVLRLATEVDWDTEKECFESVARETALFYCVRNEWLVNNTESSTEIERGIAVSSAAGPGAGNECAAGPSEPCANTENSSKSLVAGVSTSLPTDNQWKWTVEHIIYPALRSQLSPSKHFSEDGTVLQIANLPDLYKVFERC